MVIGWVISTWITAWIQSQPLVQFKSMVRMYLCFLITQLSQLSVVRPFGVSYIYLPIYPFAILLN
jgi:hypothetical protein